MTVEHQDRASTVGNQPPRAVELPVAVVMNPASGRDRQGASEQRIVQALAAAGLASDVIRLSPACDVRAAVHARAYRAAVAAGGDGTVSVVAAAVAGTELPLGVIPAGTFNHFAKDAGIPLDLDAAVHAIACGRTVRLDVAEVNGRVFVNNSSLGIYPTLVLERDRLMRKGIPKAAALALAALSALRLFPNLTVRVQAGDTAAVSRTALLFVGNNEYEFSGLQAGTRADLRGACLQVCLIGDARRAALLRVTLLALLGRLESAREFTSATAPTVRVDTFRRRVRVAVDGELLVMQSPLLYRVRPGALRVLTPNQGS